LPAFFHVLVDAFSGGMKLMKHVKKRS
jgi:hypothetical protein